MPLKRTRDRGCLDADAVASKLAPLAARSQSFVKYFDDATFDKLPGIQKDMVLQHKEVIEAVGTTALTKKVAEKAMQILAEDNADKWKQSQEVQKEWVCVISRRLRNLLHHWSMALNTNRHGQCRPIRA